MPDVETANNKAEKKQRIDNILKYQRKILAVYLKRNPALLAKVLIDLPAEAKVPSTNQLAENHDENYLSLLENLVSTPRFIQQYKKSHNVPSLNKLVGQLGARELAAVCKALLNIIIQPNMQKESTRAVVTEIRQAFTTFFTKFYVGHYNANTDLTVEQFIKGLTENFISQPELQSMLNKLELCSRSLRDTVADILETDNCWMSIKAFTPETLTQELEQQPEKTEQIVNLIIPHYIATVDEIAESVTDTELKSNALVSKSTALKKLQAQSKELKVKDTRLLDVAHSSHNQLMNAFQHETVSAEFAKKIVHTTEQWMEVSTPSFLGFKLDTKRSEATLGVDKAIENYHKALEGKESVDLETLEGLLSGIVKSFNNWDQAHLTKTSLRTKSMQETRNQIAKNSQLIGSHRQYGGAVPSMSAHLLRKASDGSSCSQQARTTQTCSLFDVADLPPIMPTY